MLGAPHMKDSRHFVVYGQAQAENQVSPMRQTASPSSHLELPTQLSAKTSPQGNSGAARRVREPCSSGSGGNATTGKFLGDDASLGVLMARNQRSVCSN